MKPAYFDLPVCPRCQAPALFPVFDFGEEEDVDDENVPAGWECCMCERSTFGAASYAAGRLRDEQFRRAMEAWQEQHPPLTLPDEAHLRWQVRAKLSREQERAQAVREGRW